MPYNFKYSSGACEGPYLMDKLDNVISSHPGPSHVTHIRSRSPRNLPYAKLTSSCQYSVRDVVAKYLTFSCSLISEFHRAQYISSSTKVQDVVPLVFAVTMTFKRFLFSRLTRRPWCLLFVQLSIARVCFGSDHDGKSPAIDIAGLDASIDASIIQVRERHNSNYHPSLASRQTYQCGPGSPCSNGACCGAGGYCGYGPTYCGPGCVSNCGAYAECGEFAQTNGTHCPLNTCCSQYGFVSHKV